MWKKVRTWGRVCHWKCYCDNSMGSLYSSGRQIEHRRPDIVVMEKNTKKCLIIDVACPVDNNLILKKNKKLDNYSELRLEIARMWDKETLIVPIMIGALRSVPNDVECNLKKNKVYLRMWELYGSLFYWELPTF